MKRIIILSALTLLLSSCTNFLTEDPKASILQDEYFETADNVERALWSLYRPLASTGLFGANLPMVDVGTDLVACKTRTASTSESTSEPFANFTLSSTSSWINTTGLTWADLWKGVLRSNYIIYGIDDVDITDVERREFIGEARCMRAFYYYYLVRLWGDLPIIMQFTDSDNFDATKELVRSPASEIYSEIIIPDLKYAAEYTPSSFPDESGRATKWLARTLLAEAYATLAGSRLDSVSGAIIDGDSYYWELARDAAWSIIGDGTCPNSLHTATELDIINGTNPYAKSWEDEWGSEALLEVGAISQSGYGNQLPTQAFSSTTGNTFWGVESNYSEVIANDTSGIYLDSDGTTNTYFSTHSFTLSSCKGTFIPTAQLMHIFEDGDLRKWGILTEYVTDDGMSYYVLPTFRKFADFDLLLGKTGTSFSYADVNFVVYRYADALLLYAEAENEYAGPTQSAYDAINAIRSRAGLDDLPAGLSQSEFRDRVRQERAVEFHGEGKRRFDLVRWNTFKEATRNYDTEYVPEDNPNTKYYDPSADTNTTGIDDMEYYFTTNQCFQYLNTAVYSGCETITEVPLKHYLLPIPSSEITKTDWSNNYGY